MISGVFLSFVLAASAHEGVPAGGKPDRELVKKAEAGEADAQNRLGMWYDDRHRQKEANVWYRKAAEQGHGGALHHMAGIYEYGWGVKEDCDKALDYYKKAEAAGVAASTFRIGYMYYVGHCLPKDYKEARYWFEKSKTPMGLFYIGLLYEQGGFGVAADPAEAARHFEKAYGYAPLPMAANHLGRHHLRRDPYRAYVWFLRGKAEWEKEDRQGAEKSRRGLSKEQRKAAEVEAATVPKAQP